MVWSVCTLILAGAQQARGAEVETTGFIEVDGRVRLGDVGAGEWYAPMGVRSGIERFETTFGGAMEAAAEQWTAIIDAQVVADASTGARSLADLSRRSSVAPLSLEVNELAVSLWDVGVMGLDLKLGHQVVQWGVGDQFNPTNTLNPEMMDDPLRFGEQLPNAMIRADYSMGAVWTLSGVLVPIFRPASLPATSAIGLSFLDRIPVLENAVRRDLQSKQALSADLGFPTIVDEARLLLPGSSLSNMSGMIRVGGAIGMTDIAVSWYTGRTDMPQAVRNHTTISHSPVCHPSRSDRCINGYMLTQADLAYPRMHVAGLNAAGELDVLGAAPPIGWRVEAAWVMPERTVIVLENDDLDIGEIVQPAGELSYGLGGERPTVVSGQPYAKWTVGLDYTIGKSVYVNTQWVHGMPDEFGYGDFINPAYVTRSGGSDWEIRRHRLGDYWVVGSDIAMGRVTLRLFSIVDLTGYRRETATAGGGKRSAEQYGPFSEDGFSAVLYPELMVGLGEGLNLGIGTVQLFGAKHTKFGDPAAGGDLAFTRVRYDF
jgi:hypothetical protein